MNYFFSEAKLFFILEYIEIFYSLVLRRHISKEKVSVKKYAWLPSIYDKVAPGFNKYIQVSLTCFWLPIPRGPRYVKPQNHLKSESKIQFPNFIWMKKRAYLFDQYGIMNESEFIKLLISGCDRASQMELSTLKISTHLIKYTPYNYIPRTTTVNI